MRAQTAIADVTLAAALRTSRAAFAASALAGRLKRFRKSNQELNLDIPIAFVFGQEVAWSDLGVIGLLVLLEGALSMDNALVLGLLAKRLPKEQQSKALTYGLVGAFAFRFIAVFLASLLLEWRVVKLLGGGYLAYIAIKHLVFERHEDDGDVAFTAEGTATLRHEQTGAPLTPEEEVAEIEQRSPLPLPEQVKRPRAASGAKFWPTVVVIELTDIAFAVDSIWPPLASLATNLRGRRTMHPTRSCG